MKSRERVLRAIEFNGPDRPPISHGILPAAQYHYGEALEEILAGVHEDFGWGVPPGHGAQGLPALYRGGPQPDEFEPCGTCPWRESSASRRSGRWRTGAVTGLPLARVHRGAAQRQAVQRAHGR